jgi:lipoyl(octanoyl) transferase
MPFLHLALPSLSSYAATHALQTHLVRHLLSLKSLNKSLPPPLVLTMELLPTFTFGRRQVISPDDHVLLSRMGMVIKSQRGGLTTYHGPGQLVGYPILDLKLHKLVSPPRVRSVILVSAVLCPCFGKLDYTTVRGIRS